MIPTSCTNQSAQFCCGRACPNIANTANYGQAHHQKHLPSGLFFLIICVPIVIESQVFSGGMHRAVLCTLTRGETFDDLCGRIDNTVLCRTCGLLVARFDCPIHAALPARPSWVDSTSFKFDCQVRYEASVTCQPRQHIPFSL